MTDGYRVPFADVETEFTEKRSRFITNLWRVESEAKPPAQRSTMPAAW